MIPEIEDALAPLVVDASSDQEDISYARALAFLTTRKPTIAEWRAALCLKEELRLAVQDAIQKRAHPDMLYRAIIEYAAQIARVEGFNAIVNLSAANNRRVKNASKDD